MCIQFGANVVGSATPDALACIPYAAQSIGYHYNATYTDNQFAFTQAAALKVVTFGGKSYTLPAWPTTLSTVTSVAPLGKTGTSTISVGGWWVGGGCAWDVHTCSLA